MGLYLASVTLNQACLAQGQVRRAAARWIACAAFFIVWNFLPIVSDEFRRVEIGFALTAGVLFALLYLVYRRPHERPEDVPREGLARGARGAARLDRRERLSCDVNRFEAAHRHLGSADGAPRRRADPDRRRPAGRGHRRGAARRPGPRPRAAALPRPRDAGRLAGDRRDRVRRRRAGADAGHDRADPDPLRGRADRRLVGDPAGARDRRLAGDDRHRRHRA